MDKENRYYLFIPSTGFKFYTGNSREPECPKKGCSQSKKAFLFHYLFAIIGIGGQKHIE
jgi:hypothetical protein